MTREPRTPVERELAFHLEMRVRELMARGMSEADARAAAERRFGDYNGPREACVQIHERRSRRMTRTAYFSELKQDIVYALRTLRRSPVFTLVAVSTLALGIGANSAIFSVVNSVVLQSLPYAEADRLYRVRTLYPDGTPYSLSAPDFMSIRQDSQALEQVEAYSGGTATMVGQGDPVDLPVAQVSDGLMPMLGFTMAAGRGFAREDHEVGRQRVVVLDHGFWQRQFGADRSIVGRDLILGGAPATVVGVLSPNQRLPIKAEMYAPVPYDEAFSASTATDRRGEFLAVIARAREGVTAERVEQDMRRIGSALQQAFPETNARQTFTSIPLQDLVVGDVRTPLLMLLGAVGFVLLVACANVANLLMARASARQEEIAVRAALGAGKGRLFRQLITESVVLGLIGGIAGLAIAYAATTALVAAQPGNIPRLDEVGINPMVIWFTLGVSLATSLLFGAIPALQATGHTLTQTLRQGGRGGSGGRGGHRARAALVVTEMALAVVLLTGAGLLIRTFMELTRPPDGVHLADGLTFRMTLQGASYANGASIRTAVATMEERVRAIPGVTAVASSTTLPLGGLGSLVGFAVEGAPPPPPDVNAEIAMASATPSYFSTIGTTLLRGRVFTDRDVTGTPPVVVMNQAGERRWFNGESAVGRFVLINGTRMEVIGVIADFAQRDRRQAVAPYVFAPFAQRTTRSVRMVVRAQGDPLAQIPTIRAELRSFDPTIAMQAPMPLTQLVDDSVAAPRFYTSLLALFAGVAIILAATGIFGVMSYAVAQRTREIGIRMALGAQTGSVVRMVLGRAIALALGGAVLGLAGAFAVGRVIQDQLYGVTLIDPLTITAVLGVLMLSAIIAGVLPARRAAHVDPSDALR
jgi:putative ABC transport system permease protein